MTKKLTLLICVFIFSSFPTFSQNFKKRAIYSIQAFGINVGEMIVNQQSQNNEMSIEAISEVEVTIIFTFKVKYIQNSIYKGDTLISSSLQTIKKGKVNSDTKLTKIASGYSLDREGEISYLDERISYSGSLLYFHEPIDIKDLYFEINGEKKFITTNGDHTYTTSDPNSNRKNEYTYEDGVLKKAAIDHGITNIYLQLLTYDQN